VVRIGYRGVTFAANLPADSTVVVGIRLRQVVLLDEIKVTGTRTTMFARTGFDQRRRIGLGQFVSPERVAELSHVSTPSQLLRDVRGIDVRCGAGGQCTVTPRFAGCLWLFVDGAAFGFEQIDAILSITQVHAVEVYSRQSSVPVEFQGVLPPKSGRDFTMSGCGAIVVWTKASTR
jgi:hypothetical protein